MLIERIVYLAIVVLASFALGFLWGLVFAKSKYIGKQRELTRRVQVLENFKQAVKVLCPKIRDGEDIEIKVDYLPQKLHSIKLPTKEEDEDTKTGELKMERATQGHPNDA